MCVHVNHENKSPHGKCWRMNICGYRLRTVFESHQSYISKSLASITGSNGRTDQCFFTHVLGRGKQRQILVLLSKCSQTYFLQFLKLCVSHKKKKHINVMFQAHTLRHSVFQSEINALFKMKEHEQICLCIQMSIKVHLRILAHKNWKKKKL